MPVEYPHINIMINRGGTAEKLAELPGKTVIEITTAISDLIEPLHKLASQGFNEIGVVANKGNAGNCQDVGRSEGSWTEAN